MRHTASNQQENTMNADETIADSERGGRSASIIQDVNGHFYVERDGGQADEAFHRGTKSDAVMRVEGYRPVTEVYPALQDGPRAPAGVELDDLYVSVSTPPADPPGRYPLSRDSARSG
jgi:hypothetical protein